MPTTNSPIDALAMRIAPSSATTLPPITTKAANAFFTGAGDGLHPADDEVQGISHGRDDGLQHLGKRLADHDGQRLQRAAEERLLALERIEHLLAEAPGCAARVLELGAQVRERIGAAQGLARVRADAVRDLGEDRVDAGQRLAAKGLDEEGRALRLGHAVERGRHLAHDVEEATELALPIHNRDAELAQLLLHLGLGHTLHGHGHSGRGALDAGDDVLHEAQGDQRLRQRLVHGLGAARCHAERERQLVGAEREHVDGLEHLVHGERGIGGGDAKRLHGLRGQARGLLRAELAEGAAGQVEHRDEELDRLLGIEAGLGQIT